MSQQEKGLKTERMVSLFVLSSLSISVFSPRSIFYRKADSVKEVIDDYSNGLID